MTSKGKKRLGIFFILLPIVLLLVAVIGYAIASFVVATDQVPRKIENIEISTSTAGLQEVGLRDTVGSIVQIILGFLGIIGVLGLFVFIPLGIVLMVTAKEKVPEGAKVPDYVGVGEKSGEKSAAESVEKPEEQSKESEQKPTEKPKE